MDNFETELSKIAIDKKCIQTNNGKFRNSDIGTCFLGVPSDDLYGREPLEKIPEYVPVWHFLLGSDQQELVAAFAHSDHCKTVRYLSVGSSSYSRNFPLDYSNAIATLKEADCPNLKHLSLGVWHLFANEHCAYGQLGDITPVLNNLSQMEDLEIYGNFEVTELISFQYLKELTVTLNDNITYLNAGPISNSTLSNLLSGTFPNLEEIFLDLDCDKNDSDYTFPGVFLDGNNLPKLTTLEITGGFYEGEKEKLIESPLYKRMEVVFLEDMV